MINTQADQAFGWEVTSVRIKEQDSVSSTIVVFEEFWLNAKPIQTAKMSLTSEREHFSTVISGPLPITLDLQQNVSVVNLSVSSLRATDNHEKKSRVERSFAVGTKSSPDASTCKSAVEYSLQKTSIINYSWPFVC